MSEYEGTILKYLPPESVAMSYQEINGVWTKQDSMEFAGRFLGEEIVYKDYSNGTLQKFTPHFFVRHDGRVSLTVVKHVGIEIEPEEEPFFFATESFEPYEVGVQGHVDTFIDKTNSIRSTLKYVAVLPVGALSDPDLYRPE